MTQRTRDPYGSLRTEKPPYIPNQLLSVSHSEPSRAARARLRLRRPVNPNDHARALGAVQVATTRRIGTLTAR